MSLVARNKPNPCAGAHRLCTRDALVNGDVLPPWVLAHGCRVNYAPVTGPGRLPCSLMSPSCPAPITVQLIKQKKTQSRTLPHSRHVLDRDRGGGGGGGDRDCPPPPPHTAFPLRWRWLPDLTHSLDQILVTSLRFSPDEGYVCDHHSCLATLLYSRIALYK